MLDVIETHDGVTLLRASARAVAVWRAGGLVAFPTETVYGLGADATNPQAVERIFAAKGRPRNHPLIVHIADAQALPVWVSRVPVAAERLAQALWPGPLTLVLPKSARVPVGVTGGQATVALRVPQHPVALALLRAFGGGVAAPSANRFGRVSPTCAAHVMSDLATVDGLLVVDGGVCAVGVESTIVDLSGAQPWVLRLGGVPLATVAAVLGLAPESLLRSADAALPRVPGALARHYAPVTPTRLQLAGLPLPLDAAVLSLRPAPVGHRGRWGQLPSDPLAAAARLYAMLRELDAAGAPELVLEALPEAPCWATIADRLQRAAAPLGNVGRDEENR